MPILLVLAIFEMVSYFFLCLVRHCFFELYVVNKESVCTLKIDQLATNATHIDWVQQYHYLAYKYSTISHLMDIFGQLCPTTLRPR